MTLVATCHCGATRIEVDASPVSATECTCTFCSKRGALWTYFPLETVRIVKAESDADYAPSGMNHHHFCAICGCGTYSLTPDWSATDIPEDGNWDEDTQAVPQAMRIGVNARLYDDFDLKSLPVEAIDGRNLW